jgi:glycosyltransferase involved in cell wall biosynthesis
MRVAYLINQYPHVSHSFIRREIAALEALGLVVVRYSIRASAADLVDPADQEERRRTDTLLGGGLLALIGALLGTALTRPARWFSALRMALRLGRPSERGRLRHLAYLAEACLLLRRLHRSNAAHLHAHFGTNSAAVALLTHLLGGPPYSFTVHGPEEFDAPRSLSLQEKIEHAAFVVAVSNFGRSQLFRWCGHNHWPKIQVVRCGVDAAFLGSTTSPIPEGNRLVCVGRLAEQKGQLLLLAALALLLSEGLEFQMVLAGDGPMRGVVEQLIKTLGLENHVRITGWLSNEAVRQEILAARALVLPSFAEGLPVVLMEALAQARPVLTTYIAGIPELVENNVNGWLIPAGSVDALANGLRELLRTPPQRLSQMGSAGAVRVAELHNVQTEAGKLASLFQKPERQ